MTLHLFANWTVCRRPRNLHPRKYEMTHVAVHNSSLALLVHTPAPDFAPSVHSSGCFLSRPNCVCISGGSWQGACPLLSFGLPTATSICPRATTCKQLACESRSVLQLPIAAWSATKMLHKSRSLWKLCSTFGLRARAMFKLSCRPCEVLIVYSGNSRILDRLRH